MKKHHEVIKAKDIKLGEKDINILKIIHKYPEYACGTYIRNTTGDNLKSVYRVIAKLKNAGLIDIHKYQKVNRNTIICYYVTECGYKTSGILNKEDK